MRIALLYCRRYLLSTTSCARAVRRTIDDRSLSADPAPTTLVFDRYDCFFAAYCQLWYICKDRCLLCFWTLVSFEPCICTCIPPLDTNRDRSIVATKPQARHPRPFLVGPEHFGSCIRWCIGSFADALSRMSRLLWLVAVSREVPRQGRSNSRSMSPDHPPASHLAFL